MEFLSFLFSEPMHLNIHQTKLLLFSLLPQPMLIFIEFSRHNFQLCYLLIYPLSYNKLKHTQMVFSYFLIIVLRLIFLKFLLLLQNLEFWEYLIETFFLNESSGESFLFYRSSFHYFQVEAIHHVCTDLLIHLEEFHMYLLTNLCQ